MQNINKYQNATIGEHRNSCSQAHCLHSKKSSYDHKPTGSLSNSANITNIVSGHANTLNVSGVMNGSGFIVGTSTHNKDYKNTLSMNMFDFAKN